MQPDLLTSWPAADVACGALSPTDHGSGSGGGGGPKNDHNGNGGHHHGGE
jgi:hypothetical protein